MVEFVKTEHSGLFTYHSYKAPTLQEGRSFLEGLPLPKPFEYFYVDLPDNTSICRDRLSIYMEVNTALGNLWYGPNPFKSINL